MDRLAVGAFAIQSQCVRVTECLLFRATRHAVAEIARVSVDLCKSVTERARESFARGSRQANSARGNVRASFSRRVWGGHLGSAGQRAVGPVHDMHNIAIVCKLGRLQVGRTLRPEVAPKG